jgi:hypothetical protein
VDARLQSQLDAIGKPIPELSATEAGLVARQPTWYNFVIPLVNAAGILAGGMVSRRLPG